MDCCRSPFEQLAGIGKCGSLSIVGVGFVKIPPQFYEKGPFYV